MATAASFLDEEPEKPSAESFLDEKPAPVAPPSAESFIDSDAPAPVTQAPVPEIAYPSDAEMTTPIQAVGSGQVIATPDSGFVASTQASAAKSVLNAAAFVADRPDGVAIPDKPFNPADQTKFDSLRSQYSDIQDADARQAEGGGGAANPQLLSIANELSRLGKAPDNTSLSGQLRDAAGSSFDYYGADPNSTNAAAQIGRGVGGVIAAAPTMVTGPFGLPMAVAQMSGGAYEEARYEKEKELRARGVTDEEEIQRASVNAGGEAFAKSGVGLGAYMLGGKLAAGLASKLIGVEATVAAKTLAGFTGATVANVGTGSVIRALEAEPGKRLEAAIPKIENLTADTLFAVIHAHGEYSGAMKKVAAENAKENRIATEGALRPYMLAQQRARAELARRGFSEEQINAPAPPKDAPTPAAVVVPNPASDEAEKKSKEEEARKLQQTAEAEQLAKVAEDGGLPATAEAVRENAESIIPAPEPPAPEPAAVEPDSAAPKPETPTPEIHRPEVELLQALRAPIPDFVEPMPEPEPGTAAPAPDAVREPAPAREPATETQVSDLETREVPLADIILSKDVPQFKSGADEEGIVEPLKGKFDRTGTGPVQLWRRSNGQLELISGRHRRRLAIDSGETTIPAQIHDEAAGFDVRAAARLDAELNIRDGQGSTADYANYFRHSEVTEADASARGLLARAKGRDGFAIARGASEDVFALHQSGRLTDAQAEAVASAAPGNDAAQRLGVRTIFAGATNADAANAIRAALLGSEGAKASQGDFFSDTGLDEQWLAQGKVASQNQKALREQIAAVQGAAKKPEVARKLGVDVKDPAGVQKRVADLRNELARWDNWSAHKDLVAITRGEEAKPAVKEDARGKDVLPPDETPFNLVSETAKDKAARLKREEADASAKAEREAAEARAQSEKDQGNLFGSKTPKTPENQLIESITAAAEKAPTEAELDAAGRSPTTVEFARPGGAGKIVVQNTREALVKLADRYRPKREASHLESIGEAVGKMRENVQNVRVRVLRNEADLPADVRAKLKPGDVHEGLADTDRGDIYIFSDNISSPERAAEVFAHEVVGHYGVERIIKPGEWKGIADSVFKLDPKEAGNIARRYAKGTDAANLSAEQRATVAREYIARLAEKPAMNPGIWTRVVQAVRDGLRALGVVKEWTEGDIRDLLRKAAKEVRDGKPRRVLGDGGISAAVRDLPREVQDHSPYATHIEEAFESALSDAGDRQAVTDFVEAKLSGKNPPKLEGQARTVAERFLTYFRNKEEFAKRNGVADAVNAAVDARLEANPNLTLAERLAVYSAETNRAVLAKTAGRAEGDAKPAASSPTSIKNAVVDEERAKRGLPPAMEPARRSFDSVWDDAMRRVDADSDAPRNLVDELDQRPRALTDTEDAMLLHRQITLQNEYDTAARSTVDAHEAGDLATAEENRLHTARLSDELQRVYDVGKRAGTATARGLNARKMMARDDFSLAAMVTRKRAANGGKPLDPEQQAAVQADFDAIDKASKAVDAAEAKADETTATETATEAVKDVIAKVKPVRPKKSPPAGSEAKPVSQTTVSWIQKQAEAARQRINDRRGKMHSDPFGVMTAADLADRVIVGAADIAGGLRDFAGWASKQLQEWGEAIKPHLQEIWDRSNALLEQHNSMSSIAEKMKARMGEEGATIGNLRPYVQKLAEGIVRTGVTELEPLLDTLHPIIEQVAPGTTRRQTMDLFSGYGDFRPLSKDAIKVQLRDLKGQAQQSGKIEDMQSGIAPKKTGPERRTPSDKERALIKEVEELKKRGGFVVTDPETQLRSAMQAVKARLRNQLVDMATQLETGERPQNKTPLQYDAEAETLRAIRDRVRETLKDLDEKPGISPEQRIKSAQDAIQRSIDEYNRRLNEDDYGPRKRAPKVSTPEIEAMRAQRDALRAEWEELRELDDAVAEQRAQRRENQLRDNITELDRKLSEGDLAPASTARAGEPSVEAEALAAERDAMTRQLAEMRREAARKTPDEVEAAKVAKLEKSIAELDEKLRAGDLSTKARTPSADSTAVEALKAERAAMQKQLSELRREAKAPTDAEREAAATARALKAYKARTAQRIAELQTKLANGDFSPKPPRRALALDPDALKAKADLERAKQEYERGLIRDRLSKRDTFERALDGAAKWRRTFVLSGVHTLAKLTSAALEIIGIAPVEEVAGAIVGAVPGIRGVAAKAPRHGGASLKAEVEAISANVTNLFRDVGDYMAKGNTDLDAIYGEAHLYPFEWKELIGRMHGALKTPARRNEWTRSFRKRMEFAARQGVDVTDPMVQTKIGLDAYKDAAKSIFTEDNMVVDAYKRGLSRFAQPEKSTGKPSVAGKIAETGFKFFLPVIRIPTNIVARTFEYTFGSVTGLGRLGAAMRRGIDNLPPEQADLIVQNLKRGSLGAAVLLIGYLNPKTVGGYYTGKRDEKDVSEGGLRVFGVDVPKYLIHNPLLEQLQLGATIRRVSDSKLRKSDKDTQGLPAGMWAAATGLIDEVPFVNQMLRTAKAFTPHGQADYFGELGRSLVPPDSEKVAMLIERMNHGSNPKRAPKTAGERVKMAIPGMRESVPLKKDQHRR